MAVDPRIWTSSPLVCFDNDGTLFRAEDVAAPGIRRAFAAFVAKHGLDLPLPTEQRILDLTGLPGPEFYRAMLPEPHAQLAPELRLRCIEEEVVEIEARGRFYDGIEPLLLELRARARKIALVTNAGEAYITAVAARLGYGHLLDGLYHFGLDGLTTKSAMIRRAMADFDVETAVMVGDRSSDIDGAVGAGVPSVLCRYGFGAAEEARGADRVVDTVGELSGLLLGA